jgi:two-component system sensor histidine kinase YesM
MPNNLNRDIFCKEVPSQIRYLFNFISNLKIQHKIFLAFAPLFLAGMLSMTFLFYNIAEQNILRKTSLEILNTLQQISDKLAMINNNVISVSNMYFLDDNVRRILQTDWQKREYEEIRALELIKNIFQLVKNNFYYLNHSTTLLGFNGYYYSEAQAKDHQLDQVRGSDWLTRLEEDPNKMLWTDTYRYADKYIFSAVNYLRDIYTGKPLGLLILDFDEDILYNTYKNMAGKEIFILSSKGNVLSSSNKALLSSNFSNSYFFQKMNTYQSGYFVTNYENEEVLISFYKVPDLEWFIVDIRSLQLLLEEMNGIKKYVYLLALIIVASVFVLSYALSHVISSPIKKLVALMNRVPVDGLNLSLKLNRRDEIGILVMKYNVMLNKIDDLIKEMVHQQELKRKAEIQALQAQITPHFLYNTLNSIRWMAKQGNVDVVNRMVISLVRLLRQTFETRNEFISYSDELKFLSDYVLIQKVRYGDKFEVKFDFAEEILNGKLLKLIIQPILENAIFHGIEPKQGSGVISIKAYSVEEYIVIEIEDDGVGMDGRERSELDNSEYSDHSLKINNGLGLRSIEQRIKLHFGDMYGMETISVRGKGTRILITVPWIE